MAMLNEIEAFQPENGASWDVYVERLNFYFEANDITSAEKKRAILMNVCGPSAYVMIRSLLSPRSLNDVTFEEILSKVKEHLNPAPSEIVFRLRFHKRSQRPNESITEYVAALRNLSENCNFGNTLDEMLRDRLVGGMRDEAIQRRLLAESNLTFDLAQKIAIAAETAHKNTEEIRTPSNETTSIQQAAKSIMLTVRMNGKPLKMEVDSGSACSIISDETFKSRWPVKTPKITVTKERLQTWSKQKLETWDTIDVEVQCRDRKCNLPLLVVKGVGASLLGRN
ncbi:conserved hypothetical protein [Trichinella spiralis]|uniref:hypothetical protein n=1 Tax=Trichinella spiralis TaxID=6334 RepID=UPI0001EFD5CB|nr:conserved hypothetical protein [Trichinella spiralis]